MQEFIDFLTMPAPEQKPTSKQEVLELLETIWKNQDISSRAYLILERAIKAMEI